MISGAAMLAFGGAVGMGMGAPLKRHVLKKGSQLFTEPEFLLGTFFMTWVSSVILLIPLWSLFGGEILVENRTVFWGAMLFWFVANVGVQTSNLFAAKYADVSLVLPYQAMTPGLLTLVVFLIGERPSAWGYLGILTIAIGTYIHGRLGAKTIWAYLIPLWRLLFLPGNYEALDDLAKQKARDEQKGVRFAFVSALCGTFGLLGEAMMARHGNPALGLSGGMILLTLFSVAWYFVMKRRAVSIQSLPPLRERLLRHRKWLVFAGIFMSMACFLPMIANRLAPIAYVGTLKRLAIPLGIFVAARWFRERVPMGRWVTTLVITSGAMILVLDDTPAKIFDFLEHLLGDTSHG